LVITYLLGRCEVEEGTERTLEVQASASIVSYGARTTTLWLGEASGGLALCS
jgi:hypothetical protein